MSAEICHSPSQTVLDNPPLEKLVSESKHHCVSKEEDLDMKGNSEVDHSNSETNNGSFVPESSHEQNVSSATVVTEIQKEDVLNMDEFDPQYLAFFDSVPLCLFNANVLHPVPLPSYDLN